MHVKTMTLKLKKLTSAIKISHLAYAGLIVGQVASSAAHAGPKGGVVVGGEGSIDSADLTTIVEQKSDLLAIDWDSFNLSEDELVRFLQPNSSSVVLNRILDQNPSEIRGSIEANGHVILANPRGVLFTETATVNVGAITAAGLDISPADFMKGKYAFKGEDGSTGVVVNRGLIKASSAVLVGKQVTNAGSGLISAEMVSLAAGNEAVLTFDPDGMIGVKVSKEVMENQLGIDSAVLNQGKVEGAQVLMDGSVSSGLFTSAVNNAGTVRARSIDTSGGKIRLMGSGAGAVNSGMLNASGSSGGEVVIDGDSAEHSGSIDVSGSRAGGGKVEVLGDRVAVSGTIDARGSGGGEVLIGGDYQGKNAQVRNAKSTSISAEASIDASGTGNSDGGKVIVWADQRTDFAGSIRAESGQQGGDGGFVETSGKVNLHLGEETMSVSTLAFGEGETGTWLLDPSYLQILDDGKCIDNCISGTDLVTALKNNSVTVNVSKVDSATTTPGGIGTHENNPDYSGGILVGTTLDWSSGNELTLKSHTNVTVSKDGSIVPTAGSLSVTANGNFENSGTVTVADLALLLDGSFINSGTISADTLDLKVGLGDIDTDNTLGNLTVSTSGSITGGSQTDTVNLYSSDDAVQVDSSTSFTLSGNISFDAVENIDAGSGEDTVSLLSPADVNLNGNDGEATIGSLFFQNIDVVSNGNLVASDSGDRYIVTGTGSLTANAIGFSGVTSVTAGSGSDTVTGDSGFDWLLQGSGTAKNNGITFDNVETFVADAAGLQGTSADETYTLEDDGSVTVDGLNFQSLTGVNAGDGEDIVESPDGITWELGGVNGSASVKGTGFSFTAIEKMGTANAIIDGTKNAVSEDYTLTGSTLTVLGIDFTSVSAASSTAGDGNTVGGNVTGWALGDSSGSATAGGIDFSGIDQVDTTDVVIDGTSNSVSEDYTLTGSTLTVLGIDFTSVSAASSTAGDGNTVDGNVTGWALGDSSGSATAGGIDFSGIDQVDTTDVVIDGTSNSVSEDYTLTGSTLTVLGIDFTSASAASSTAGDGNTVDGNVTGWALGDSSGSATAGGIDFSGIDQVDTTDVVIDGTSNSVSEDYTLSGSTLTVLGIDFTSASAASSTAGDGNTVDGNVTGWALGDSSGSATAGGIDFSGIDQVDTTDVVIDGTSNSVSEDYTLTGSTLTVLGIDFTSASAASSTAGDGNTVDGNVTGWALGDSSGSATAGGIDFSGIDQVDTTDVVIDGTSNSVSEDYTLTGSTLTVLGIDFTSVSAASSTAGDGNTVDGNVTGWALGDSSGSATAGGIDFSGIDQVDTTDVVIDGTSNSVSEDYTLTGSTLTVLGIDFTSVSAASSTAGDGNTVDGNVTGWALGDSSGSATAAGIDFSGIDQVDTTDVVIDGTSNSVSEDYTLSGSTLTVLGIDFTSVSAASSTAGDGNTVDGNVTGWALGDSSGSATAAGIDFSGIDQVDTTDVVIDGTSNSVSEDYTLTGSTLTVLGIDFTSVSAASSTAGDGNTVDGNVTGWALGDSSGSATAAGIDFSGIDQVDTTDVVIDGTSNSVSEDYTLTGSTLTVLGIDFTSVSAANSTAGDGNTVDGNVTGWTLGDSSGSATAGGIDFSGIDQVDTTDVVIDGTSNSVSEDYTLTGSTLTVLGIDFTSASEANSAAGDVNTVTSDASSWTLTGSDGGVRSGLVTFSGIDTATSTASATLIGTSGNDNFALDGSGKIAISGVQFSGFDMVDAGGGDDDLDADGLTLALTGTDNEVQFGSSLIFSYIESATVKNLQGTTGDDNFSLPDGTTKSVSASSITFVGVDDVDGLKGTVGSNDTVSAVSADVKNTKSFRLNDIHFSNINQINAQNITLDYSNNSIEVTGANTVVIDDQVYEGVYSVNAGDGTDTVTGLDGQDWTITGVGAATNNAIDFTFVEVLQAVNAGIIAPAGLDSFSLVASDINAFDVDMPAASLLVKGATDFQAAGSGILDASYLTSGVSLAGSKQVYADGDILFDGVTSVTADSLTTSGTVAFTAGSSAGTLTTTDIDFDGLSTVNAGSGSADGLAATGNITLLGGGDGFTSNGIDYYGINTVSAGTPVTITGSDDGEAFSLSTDNQVDVTTADNSSIHFGNVSDVSAGAGYDTIDTAGDVTLTGFSGEVISALINFTGIDGVTSGNLVASDNGDEYVVTGDSKLQANGIDFSAITSVVAGSGSDKVTGLSGANWSLSGGKPQNSNISFTNVEEFHANNAGLDGSGSADSFTLEGAGAVRFGGFLFEDLLSVDGAGGDDSVNITGSGLGVTLAGSDYDFNAGNIAFTAIENVTAADLTGSGSADAFTVTGDHAVDAWSIQFSGIDSISAGADDSLAADLVTLTDTDNQVVAGSITVSGIDAVSTASLEGTSSADSFEILGDKTLRANLVTFNGVDTVDALGGQDSVVGVDGSQWQLGTVENSNIAFAGVEAVDANNGSLLGTAAAESFTLNASGSVVVGTVTFTNLSSVDGNGGSDDLDASAYSAGLALSGSDNQLDVQGMDLTLSGIVTATVNKLTGSSAADEFALDASDNLVADATTFTGVTTIAAGDGSDLLKVAGDARSFAVGAPNSLSFGSIAVSGLEQLQYSGSGGTATGAAGTDWSLVGSGGQAENNGVSFDGVQTLLAQSAGLLGTAAGESFALADNGDVSVYGLIFQGLSSVDGADGADVVTLASSAAATLNGSDGEAQIRTIDFSHIEGVSNGTVEASAQADRFVIVGANQLRANDIAFSGISVIDGLGGSDSVTGDGSDWTLTTTDGEFENSGIRFSGIDSIAAAGGGLYGPDTAEQYALGGGGAVTVEGATITGLAFVDAGSGSDQLDVNGYSGALALTGISKQLDAGGLLFSDIDNIDNPGLMTTPNLNGSSGDDSFTVAADGSVTVADMQFTTGLASIDAGTGDDRVAADGDVSLKGNSGKASIGGIDFSNIEHASGTGIGVIATDGDDSFEILADGSVTAHGINIEGVGSIDALAGDDTVTGASGFNWLLIGSGQAQNNGVTFSHVEHLIAVSAGLEGSADADSFTLLSSGDISTWDMTVSGMTSVSGGSGSDSLYALDYDGVFSLTGVDNQLDVDGLVFAGIENAELATLSGSTGADSFAMDSSGAVTAGQIRFTGISALSGGDGNDSVDSAADQDWTLLADNTSVDHAGITFSNIEQYSGGSKTLHGSDSATDYAVEGSGSVSVGSLQFSGLDTVAAGAASDALTALDTVTLSGSRGAFGSSDISFSGFEAVQAASLAGSAADDSFELTADSTVSIYELLISGVDTLDGGAGSDSVTGDGSDWTLTTTDGEFENSGIRFSGIDSIAAAGGGLYGPDTAEQYALGGGGAVTVEGATITGLAFVDAGSGSDQLDVNGYSGALALTGISKQLDAGGLLFSDIDNIDNPGLMTTPNLNGSSGDDSFTVAADGSVTVADMQFTTGLASIDAGTGDDRVAADGDVSLKGNSGKASIGGIDFSNIEHASGTGIGVIATDGDDSFEILADGSVTAHGINIEGVGSIDALAGDDTVTGASGFNWLLIGSGQAQNNGVTFSHVEHLIAVSAGLEGSADADSFTLLSSGDISTWDMTVSGMTSVSGGSGSDSLYALDYDGVFSLTGVDNQLDVDGLVFAGIENAELATLSGSTGADSFAMDSSGAVTAGQIRFTGISALSGGDGNDSVDSAADQDWTLLADNTSVDHAGITFSNIEQYSGGSKTLHGSDSATDYAVEGSGSVSVGSLQFSGLDTVAAGAASDALTALDTVTLSGSRGAFGSSDISFSGFEAVQAASLAGSAADDSFELTADSTVSIYDLLISGVDTLDGGAGSDTVIGRSGQGYQLNSDGSVLHDGITFVNSEQFAGQDATLSASGSDDSFQLRAADSLRLGDSGPQFSGLLSADGGAGDNTLVALGDVAIEGDGAVRAGEIQFAHLSSVAGTGTLTGTDGDDQFAASADGRLDSYGIDFRDVTGVNAGAGSDALAGLATESWQLSGTDNALSHAGIDFTGLESTSGGNGILNGSAFTDAFVIRAERQVTAGQMTFADIDQVNAGAGTDSVAALGGSNWVLGVGNGSATASAITFSDIETVSGQNLQVDAASNSATDNFVLSSSGRTLTARGIQFASVSAMDAGSDGGDVLTSDAGTWQLTGNDGELSVNGVSLAGIDRVITSDASLAGTGGNDTFAIDGEGALTTAGIAFEGIDSVSAGAGSDRLLGTTGADNFVLADSGDIGVAAINFSGIETVAAGAGGDTVSASGASWTSTRSGAALVDNSAQATVNSLTVLFEGLERVDGTGTYVGQDLDSEYQFSSLDTMTIAGVTFAGLRELTAGSGADLLRGADIDAQWQLDATGGSINSGGDSLLFSGVDSIVAGSGADQFSLSGGEYTSVDTGGGNDTALLAGTLVDSLLLGAGDDRLQVSVDSSRSVQLSGGGGNDEFQFNVAGKTWQMDAGDTRVGDYQFNGFEWLDNNSDSLTLETSLGFDFVNGGGDSSGFNRNGAGILFAGSGVRLGYNGAGDVAITSTSSDTIGGDLQADRADLQVAGDVDISTDVNTLAIHSGGENVDIAVLADKDLVIDEIDAGRGSVSLNSAGFGSLTGETYGDTHITASTVNIGSDLQQWSVVGSAINPLRMNAADAVNIVAISYFEPDFIGQQPAFTSTGDELQSVAGAQAAQGLKSAVQNAVEDFAQVDPGIFSAVNPYSSGVDAVNTPEMQLIDGKLQPVVAGEVPADKERERRRSAELQKGDGDKSAGKSTRAALPSEAAGG
ncbi:filamentous hemagglutinin N-terminal domain-containing protein [Microbulbifer sp. SAOS-129_SWC]|uniref:filamentous hemagglutinin N-terminal domain-containing protein n=1 Tax=Microbulbifer sp. SAOS-129_SWC TaxID=3145235 RepID=UPI00321641D3